jgi:hypothetical protein
MKRFRFTIAHVFIIVIFVAIGLAALREANELWDHLLFGATLLALATSVLLAFHGEGRRRAYWLGFALFGGVYLGASLIPPVESRLPTTHALQFIEMPGSLGSGSRPIRLRTSTRPQRTLSVPQTLDVDTVIVNQISTAKIAFSSPTTLTFFPGPSEHFVRVAHSLFALLLGLFGGALSVWLAERERRRRAMGSAEAGVAIQNAANDSPPAAPAL